MKFILIAPLLLTLASAKEFTSAVISEKINQVTVYHTSKKPRSAVVKERVDQANIVETGRRSRAELTFPDETITRLGANTSFSFKPSKRRMELQKGTMLLQVPKNSGGATIFTSSVAAAIRGTTILFEYNKGKWIKLISLEGKVELQTKKAGTVKLKGGQMVFLKDDGSLLTRPVDVDLQRLVSTSQLLNKELFGALSDDAEAKIIAEIKKQQALLRKGTLARQNVSRKSDVIAFDDTVARQFNTPPMEECPHFIEE